MITFMTVAPVTMMAEMMKTHNAYNKVELLKLLSSITHFIM